MFILIYLFFTNVLIPDFLGAVSSIIPSVLIITITLAGIVILLSSVGLKISNNLGSSIVYSISKGIGCIVKSLFKGIFWIIKSVIGIIPKMFSNIQKNLISNGARLWLANLVATVSVILFIAILV